ncbi:MULTISPECIES: SOS response-associated peptidase [unclassified Pseudomonas]|uniref:SOS response-associated peptidase n=1 Tax=unclassified Pseudomonas TaxID=196821 RepID=UPI002AC9AEB2|nr:MULTISPECIES: SOS response-associated peptidase [unclassified Pseudomonas]MEB0043394.1 SOS response-associated peptidase [Pseudomonas sp. MH10]MEB0080090.1 SOS response-associated peptidase [Pseudomonas sp. MH10out]MEB0094040.1 SOS response-associated peptidase [Pseudomonas sp. CCI4.2]MEB0103938.1 SOS response-associated peptidase [Pseudomonas sp. CCI3.2]MEB0123712.1 SOS response-associated peptidase [Pseudomonas sp. CCI1.2]
MCGRYALFRWNPAFAALPGFPADQKAQWNISPTDSVLMLRGTDSQREVARARWGLTPPWLTDLSRTPAHARAETLAEQPMFRQAFRERRCLLPANGFYEWRGTTRKRPFWLTPGEGSTLFFAGIWEAYPVQEHTYLSVAVVTQAAASQRRPLILDAQGQAAWLNPETPIQTLQALLASPQSALRERGLANLVNDPKLNAPECLTPL